VRTASSTTDRAAPKFGRLLRVATALTVAFLAAPAWAAGSVTPSLPGPPPTAGQGLPPAPAPGTVPVAGPVGPPASLPTTFPGPGLTSGFVSVHGRQLTLAIACTTGGRVSLTASLIGSGVLARGGYVCRARRGSAQLSLRPAAARRLTALRSTLARVALGRGTAERFSVTLEEQSTAPSYWSNGGVECSLLGPYEPYLVAPNFTVSPPAIIDVRPWVAWYTPENGWRWLGTNGTNNSSWYRWADTASGVSSWMTPAGALNPWTWAPIRVPAGQGTYMIGAFELIYWYAHPRYVWAYARSRLNATAVGTYCTFP
jgi:hypothetical protein